MRTGQILHADDTDVYDVFGRARVGYDGTNSDIAGFSHRDTPTGGWRVNASGYLGHGTLPTTQSKITVYTGAGAFNGLQVQYNDSNVPIVMACDNNDGSGYLASNTVQIGGGSTDQKYANSNYATKIKLNAGQFRFFNAASGTAGDTISWTEQFYVDANGYAKFTSRFGCNGVTPAAKQTHVADGKTDYTTGDLDTEAEVISAINTINTKLNSILSTLETFGFHATS
jgi:hypothetical protein